MSGQLLTDKQVCEIIWIHPVTLRRLLKFGKKTGLRSVRRVSVGKRRRWCAKSLDKFIHGKEQ